jgi:hypothetical protein
MSGSGPAIDGDDIYLATANGMDPGTKRDNFAQNLLKLRYAAGVADVNNGKPTLAVIDYWGASSGFERRDKAAPRPGGSSRAGPWLRRRRPHSRAR